MGGEKLAALDCYSLSSGSPPRGRGKDEIDIVVQVPSGITPAWAGKSPLQLHCIGLCWDHPRVGGEKKYPNWKMPKSSGSPPRGRGKVSERLTGANYARITPAWAGKSGAIRVMNKTTRDHPRVGGEKRKPLSARSQPGGSPPRGRGKGYNTLSAIQQGRITPAWAGKSRPFAAWRPPVRDHPRVGGEKDCFFCGICQF